MNRKKRLEKGINSIKKQIEIHKEKLREAKERGLEEMADYYEKDISRLEKQQSKKQEKLEKD